MDPLEIIESTAEPAFATDESGRVVIWNTAAQDLLGYPPEDILGQSCHEVICGRDGFGNRFCHAHCNIMAMILHKESINRFPLTIRKADGRELTLWFTIISVPGAKPAQYTIIHILGPVVAELTAVGSDVTEVAAVESSAQRVQSHDEVPSPALTAREHEVLELMADGRGTADIADSLYISVATVRSHTQNILSKLSAHSKLEAVAIALRKRLV